MDIHVVPGNSIQSAIQSAQAGDRLLVQPGTYFESIDYLGKAIEVVGVGGPQVTVLDAGSAGTAVRLISGEGPGSVLRGFTVTHGSGGLAPGGVWASGNPTLEDCVVVQNTGRQGAGVRGNPTMIGCTIQNNTSSLNHGGGVYGAPTMINCRVEGNTCTGSRGGGLYLVGGAASLFGCVIVENRAVLSGGRGGGLYVDSTASVSLEGCVIARNQVSGGSSGSYGGGAFVESGSVSFRACTIVDNILNTGNLAGGGVYGPASVLDSIVRGNAADQLANAMSVRYSNVSGGHSGLGNIDQAPFFWDSVSGDYHLMAGSPCVDAGDPASPLDPDGTRADMGAYPLDASWPPPTNYCVAGVNSTGVEASILSSGSWSLASNDFALLAKGCPANVFGLFFQGASAAEIPLFDGVLCIAAPQYRLGVLSTSGSGEASSPYDSSMPGNGAPSPTAGSTWRYQFWYRDPSAHGGSGANLTDGLAVTFIP